MDQWRFEPAQLWICSNGELGNKLNRMLKPVMAESHLARFGQLVQSSDGLKHRRLLHKWQ